MRVCVLAVLVIAVLISNKAQAQQHQARDWHCVRQPMVADTDGNVTALQCEAALPKGEKLDAEDEDTLTSLEIVRHNAATFTQLERDDPKKWSSDNTKGIELKNSLRMGFGQKVGQLCQKHPNIVLAPLFPDLSAARPILYGCKKIVAAPEK